MVPHRARGVIHSRAGSTGIRRVRYTASVPERNRKFGSLAATLAAVLLIAAAFGGGVYVGYERRPAIEKVKAVLGQESPTLREVDFSQFWDVWARLENEYVDRANIDRAKLVDGAIAGMVRSLGDPYTVYLPPVQSKQFLEDVRGNFGGIGAEIGIRKDILTIIAPLKGSPAERAGLRSGDKIFKINATSTDGLSLEEAVSYIRGEIGTTVTLTVARDTDIEEVKVMRDNIVIPIITAERKGNGIFSIHLMNFSEKSPQEFRGAVRDFLSSTDERLILDLRGNPGGYLDAAVDIASWFIPGETIVARERFADGTETVYKSSGHRLLENIKVVALIDQGSASASEILAGALRDDKRVLLIGQKSFGKGSVQTVDNLRGGASLKVTIAKWLTPSGYSINDKGLEPDIAVEITKDDIENGKDPQLEKAIEVLKGL